MLECRNAYMLLLLSSISRFSLLYRESIIFFGYLIALLVLQNRSFASEEGELK